MLAAGPGRCTGRIDGVPRPPTLRAGSGGALANNRPRKASRYSSANALSGMRRAAWSRRVRNAARCSGVVAPPASRSRSYSASDERRGRVQHRLHAVGAAAADQRVGILAGRQARQLQAAVGREQWQREFGGARRSTTAGGIAVEAEDRRRDRRHSSSSCSSVSAVPRGATAPPILPGEGDHVHVAFNHHQSCAARARRRARGRARRVCGAWRTAPFSGPLTYFGWPSPRMRPPKLMTRPRRSRIGNITRLKNRSNARPVSSSPPHQSGFDDWSGVMPSRARSARGRPAFTSPAEGEAADRLLRQAAAEQVAERVAALGQEQAALVAGLGGLQHGGEVVAAPLRFSDFGRGLWGLPGQPRRRGVRRLP